MMTKHMTDLHGDTIKVEGQFGDEVRIKFEQSYGREAVMRLDKEGAKEFINVIAEATGLEEIAKLTETFVPPFNKGDIVSYVSSIDGEEKLREVLRCEQGEDKVVVYFANGGRLLDSQRLTLICKAENRA